MAHEEPPKEHDAELYGPIRRFRKSRFNPFEWSRPKARTILAGLLAVAGVTSVGVMANNERMRRILRRQAVAREFEDFQVSY